jgi:hypothetical protein
LLQSSRDAPTPLAFKGVSALADLQALPGTLRSYVAVGGAEAAGSTIRGTSAT